MYGHFSFSIPSLNTGMVMFHLRLPSTFIYLPPSFNFHLRLSSTFIYLSPSVIFTFIYLTPSLIFHLRLSSTFLHIVLYIYNNHPTWLVSYIFQMSLGSSDHQFHNLVCLKQNFIWANVLSLPLRLGSGMNSPSI